MSAARMNQGLADFAKRTATLKASVSLAKNVSTELLDYERKVIRNVEHNLGKADKVLAKYLAKNGGETADEMWEVVETDVVCATNEPVSKAGWELARDLSLLVTESIDIVRAIRDVVGASFEDRQAQHLHVLAAMHHVKDIAEILVDQVINEEDEEDWELVEVETKTPVTAKKEVKKALVTEPVLQKVGLNNLTALKQEIAAKGKKTRESRKGWEYRIEPKAVVQKQPEPVFMPTISIESKIGSPPAAKDTVENKPRVFPPHVRHAQQEEARRQAARQASWDIINSTERNGFIG